MKKKLICIFLFTTLVCGTTGCAKRVALTEYESLQAEFTSLEADHEVLIEVKTDLEISKEDLEKDKTEQDKTIERLLKVESDFNELQSVTSDFMALSEEQRTVAIEAAKKEDELAALEARKQELEGQVGALQQTIDGLNGDIIRIKGEARTYPAGYLTAGTDFEAGRYKIYGGSSNFVVYSSSGKLQVNIILGGSWGVDEYIYSFASGDKVEASSSFKLVPVE